MCTNIPVFIKVSGHQTQPALRHSHFFCVPGGVAQQTYGSLSKHARSQTHTIILKPSGFRGVFLFLFFTARFNLNNIWAHFTWIQIQGSVHKEWLVSQLGAGRS